MKFELGQKVDKDGYEGNIVEVCTGQLEGMYVVRLDSGNACVSGHDLKPLQENL